MVPVLFVNKRYRVSMLYIINHYPLTLSLYAQITKKLYTITVIIQGLKANFMGQKHYVFDPLIINYYCFTI